MNSIFHHHYGVVLMKQILLAAVAALTAACASAAPAAPAAPEAPAPVAPAQAQAAPMGLAVYEGTYSMQSPDGVLTARIWADAGVLHGELVETGHRSAWRATDTPHKFLHANSDLAWLLFAVENGRATGVTLHQRGREMSGSRRQ